MAPSISRFWISSARSSAGSLDFPYQSFSRRASRAPWVHFDWIKPLKAWKSAEIPIRRCENGALFNSHRRQRSISEQRSSSLVFNCQFFQNVRVASSWLNYHYAWERKPAANNFKRLLHRQRLEKQSRVCGNSKKSPDGEPCQSDPITTGQNPLDPCPSGVMFRSVGIVGVQEKVSVENRHLWFSPSPSSNSAETLS